ncbi:MAG: glycosyltransferase [Clostridia bacterium]|nr:glycosyltransferase [Clostridia bacterium]
MNILILSTAPFPDGNASSTYILNVCRTMVACGHNVTVVGCRRTIKTEYPLNGEYEGIKYVNFDATAHNKLVMYVYNLHFEVYAKHILRKLEKPEVVFLYGGIESTAKAVRKYCHRRSIKFGGFNCEWYTEECFSATVSKRHVKGTVGLIPYVAKNADAGILISSLLTDYFKEQGTHAVMIPNIVDLTDEKWNVKKDVDEPNKLKIAYAGVPGVGKDELGTVVRAIGEMPEELKAKTELHVYGPDEKGLLSYLKTQGIDEVPNYVVCHGRQKQDEIPAKLNECHFTVLIRKPTRRANAGFSTKMVESFAAGIPFIANITGDIGTYLKDGENGIVVADESVEACRDALIRAWEMLDKNPKMRKSAYETAVQNFDYRLYSDAMGRFLSKI